MKVLIVFCAIAMLSFSFSIQNKKSQLVPIQGSNNLKFSNQTGSGCSAAEFNSFINYINLASSFHRDQTENSLRYISEELYKNYATSSYSKFSTIMQSNDSYYSWYIYSYASQFATTSSKVDRNFPNRSFMFIKNQDWDSNLHWTYFWSFTKGSGIDSSKQKVINNVILSQETSSSCYCYPKDISLKLQQYDGQTWSVICSEQFNHYFYIYTKNSQYIYTNPKNCYYTLWVA